MGSDCPVLKRSAILARLPSVPMAAKAASKSGRARASNQLVNLLDNDEKSGAQYWKAEFIRESWPEAGIREEIELGHSLLNRRSGPSDLTNANSSGVIRSKVFAIPSASEAAHI